MATELLWEERSLKITAVIHADEQAGLDLRRATVGDGHAWTITSFRAGPRTRTRLDVLTAILDAADATGTVLLLNAANRRLAAEYHAPVGFVVRPGRSRQAAPDRAATRCGACRGCVDQAC